MWLRDWYRTRTVGRSYCTRKQHQIVSYKRAAPDCIVHGLWWGEENGRGNKAVRCICEMKWSPNVTLSFGSSKPRRYDNNRHPIITVIDRSGIHKIGVSWCRCHEAPKHNMQLMMAGLFPATFHNPKTAFTFWVLEDFHLDNLECKTTPSQFVSCLRRLTNDEFPNTVPVGGHDVSAEDWLTGSLRTNKELLRVCWQWRALISQKQFGFGYEGHEEQKPRSMAIFCALCAQPGINLPENWREYENRYVTRHQHPYKLWQIWHYHFSDVLFMRGFMMDRNFQAEHMKMRNPENDVSLSEGTGFMVSRIPYELHLQSASERQQVISISRISAGRSWCSNRGQHAMITVQ